MNGKKTFNLFFAAAGMELSWLFAAAGFLVTYFGSPSAVLLQGPLAFFLAAGLTLFLRGRNQRLITRLVLQLLLLAVLFLPALYYSGYRGEAFWSREWMAMLLQGPSNQAQALRWGVAATVTLIFWCGGFFLARRPFNHFSTTLRFDAGVGVFAGVFILTAVTGIPAMPVILLLFPFFLFSMLAIALARSGQGDARGVFLQKYRGSGPILTFAASVLLGGSAVVLLFFPLLTRAAEAGYAVMRHYGPQLAELLGRLILLMFGYGARLRRTPPPAESTDDSLFIDPAAVPQGEAGFWELLIGWASVIVLGSILLFMLGCAFWLLLRWLWSGKNGAEGQRRILPDMFDYLGRWYRRLQRMTGLVRRCFSLRRRGGGGTGAYFFMRLLRWGQHSGLARLAAETPYEYSRILGRNFPALQSEIALILTCYHDEVYGGIALEGGMKRQLQSAWHRLCSPRCWPARLHLRLIRYYNNDKRF